MLGLPIRLPDFLSKKELCVISKLFANFVGDFDLFNGGQNAVTGTAFANVMTSGQ